MGNNNRISYSEIDIGACEFYLSSMDACGDIDEITTWTADTVRVNCDIRIPDTYTLTINAGALVQFQGPYKIEVHGSRKDFVKIYTVGMAMESSQRPCIIFAHCTINFLSAYSKLEYSACDTCCTLVVRVWIFVWKLLWLP